MQAFELIDAADANPYHLYIYMLTNFRLTDWKNPIVYYYAKSKSEFAEKVLACLPSHFIRHTEKQEGFQYIPFTYQYIPQIAKLTFADSVMEEDYHFLRELFEQYRKPRIPGKRVYITRNEDSKHHTVRNEEELCRLLDLFQFKRINMRALSIEDQIGEISSADIVLAPHGAGLVYTVFCDRDVTVIEIASKEQKYEGQKRHFGHIAWVYSFEFWNLWSPYVKESDSYVVDCEQLKRYLLCHPKCADDCRKLYG